VTLIVAGAVRVPAGNVERFRPHMTKMMAASRGEDGCLAYGYAENVAEPGLIHVFGAWRDQVALDAHFKMMHMAEWRAAWPSFGVSDRRLIAYEVASEREL
jgi:quinol monooxygenase YgiN